MSDDRFEFLRSGSDAERWVWLALRLEGLSRRIDEGETGRAEHARAIVGIERRCAARRWVAPTVKGLVGGLLAATAGAAAYFFDKLWAK